MKRADFHRYADLSGCIWAAEELRDRFDLDLDQAHELALCIFWHTRSRAVFLLKCQALLQDSGPWAEAFTQVVRKARGGKKPGAIGSYIMEDMVDPKVMGRMASELIRAFSFHIVWRPGEEGAFTPDFVASQCVALRTLLRQSEKLKADANTGDFLGRLGAALRHLGQFALPTVLPVCYMLGLVDCDSRRAAEAPIMDVEKAHYMEFVALGVDPKYFDLTLLVVALQFRTTPMTIEGTGCEGLRKQRNVHDFMLKGQGFYAMRPVPGCNYRHARFAVYVKKWGPQGVWVPAVRDAARRWRHP